MNVVSSMNHTAVCYCVFCPAVTEYLPDIAGSWNVLSALPQQQIRKHCIWRVSFSIPTPFKKKNLKQHINASMH